MEFDLNQILGGAASLLSFGVLIKIGDWLLKRRGVSMDELDKIITRLSDENKRLEDKILSVEGREEDCVKIRKELEEEIKQLRDWKGWLDENVLKFHKDRLEGEQRNDN